MIVNDTTYKDGTPQAIIDILEESRRSGKRLRIHYGHTEAKDGHEAGHDWLEEYDVTGHIGRSTGPIKIPLMIANATSSGGPGILEHCIVKIREASGGRVLYKHPHYHHGAVTLHEKLNPAPAPNGKRYCYAVKVDGKEHAAFETAAKRAAWLHKMGLDD